MTDQKETVEVDNRPTSQKDLEARLARGFMPERPDNTTDDVLNPEKVYAPYATEEHDTSAYLGVSPEYMQYANPSDKPYKATEGPEADALEVLQTGVAPVRKTAPPVTEYPKTVGSATTETVYTATSGEDYSAKLVDPPKETQVATNGVGLDIGQLDSDEAAQRKNTEDGTATGEATQTKTAAPASPTPQAPPEVENTGSAGPAKATKAAPKPAGK